MTPLTVARALAPALALTLLLPLGAGAAPPFFRPAAPELQKLRGGLPLWFVDRPAADGSGRSLRAASEAPIIVHFASAPTAADVAQLEGLGVAVARQADGRPRTLRRLPILLGRASAEVLRQLVGLPRVTRVELDGLPFGAPRPLDGTAAEVQATDVWLTQTAEHLPVTGHGITVCDSDSGIDVFHPLFFRADGGYFPWRDENGNGKLDPATDSVELAGYGVVTLRVLNAVITYPYDTVPLFGSDSPAFQVGLDWLYADLNDNGVRDYGSSAGFSDSSPSFGEPLLVVDDVNGNEVVDLGEKLVALGMSKIKAVRHGSMIYRRGQNLIEVPRDDDIEHGTGASGVIAGGAIGLTRKVGLAPDAELIMARRLQSSDLLQLAHFCVAEGAQVVLHEYAPWVGYHLDGSSPMEQLIDETSAGQVAHINPAGNLSTSQKLYKRMHPAGQPTTIQVNAPGSMQFRYFGFTLLWREPSRNLQVVLEDPTGHQSPTALPTAGQPPIYDDWHDGLLIWAERDDSDRGTAKLDIYVFEPNLAVTIPNGVWQLHVTDPFSPTDPDVEVIGFVADDASGWGLGIYFPEHASEDHLIGWPGTADTGIAVAAYTGHGYIYGFPGERAYYSGRGHRIDGVDILSVSAPDDPITAGYHTDLPAKYVVYSGTSGASPHVAGAAALLFQQDPGRTGADVRQAIRAGALADDVVGQVPNDDWGWGKLRIYRSIYGTDPPQAGPPSISVADVELALGQTEVVPVAVSDAIDPAGALTVELDRDYDGEYEELLPDHSFEVKGGELGTYFHKLRVTSSRGAQAATLARVDVVEQPPEPPPPPPPPAADRQLTGPILNGRGWGCAVLGRQPTGALSGWLLLLAAALPLIRRSPLGAATPAKRGSS